MQTIVEARNLTKSYGGRRVVDGIGFAVQRGECFGILGPNGAGKSTTLRMIIGFTPPDGGELTLFGQAMHPDCRGAMTRVGVVSQEDNLDIDLTVGENLLVYGRYFGLPEGHLRQRVEELLAFAQLEERRDSPVRALSGGMRRRLVIARALVAGPELVVLDEPTTGLDPQARHLIWRRLRALRESGVTLLLTTHYMEEAAQLCDRLFVLDQGRILDLGSPVALIRRHVAPEVVEVRWNGAGVEEALDLGCDMERVGDTVYCYTAEAVRVLDQLRGRRDLTYLHRPANLEDVFLRLTGRELRD